MSADLNQTAQALAASKKALAGAQANTRLAQDALANALAAEGILVSIGAQRLRPGRLPPAATPATTAPTTPPAAADFNALVTNLANCVAAETAEMVVYNAALEADTNARAAVGA
jgi:hypothetical protein